MVRKSRENLFHNRYSGDSWDDEAERSKDDDPPEVWSTTTLRDGERDRDARGAGEVRGRAAENSRAPEYSGSSARHLPSPCRSSRRSSFG